MAHKVERGVTNGNWALGSPIHNPGRRPPLHSVAEIADELGVPAARLSEALSRPGAPTVRLVCGIAYHGGGGKHRYVKAEVLRWYRTLTAPHTPTEPPAAAEGGAP